MKYLIVGASSGLGRELAYKFARENKNLIIISRDERDLVAIKSDLEIKYNITVNYINLDFSSIDEINNKLLSQEQLLKDLQGMLFPVGLMFDQDDAKLDSKKIEKLIYTNFVSITYCIQKLSKYFEGKNNPSIIGFGSVSGLLGRGINTTYAGSKRALESYFESLSFDKNFKETNIQFYILGYLDTNLSFGKDLKLPKGSISKLSDIVFKNINISFKKTVYPYYWNFISFVLKILPFYLIHKFSKILSK